MGKYHFIAIGGIGMSGLAKYLLEEGHSVSGSDLEDSKYINKLRDLNAKVFIGHNENNLQEKAIVITSTAIRENNSELIKARELGCEIYHRSDLLEEIALSAQTQGKCFIGFSGTHGKTTTSGMASFVLEKAGLKPAFVVGGIVPAINTNAQHKDGEFFIAELDESDGTIVKYNPDILVINNLECDHIDFYKNGISDLVETFDNAVSKSKKVIINKDDKNIHLLNNKSFVTFGLNNADYTAKNIEYSTSGTIFDIYYKDNLLTNISISLSGEHNVYNTLAVVAAINESGLGDIKSISKYFDEFTGMGRRFEKIGEIEGITIFDDYAHHPTEIKATLNSAAQKFGKEHVVAVFQPHRYTRLQGLWEEFKESFENANKIFVTDIFEASEDPIEGITTENFVSELKGAGHLKGSMEDCAKQLLPQLSKGDVVIGLGAGTITNLGKYLIKYSGELSCK